MKLLTRDEFRTQVLTRNNGFCCVPACLEKAVDAHHIFNRNLFTETDEVGGYFLNNGAQLCSDHHYAAELTKITVQELWDWCNVKPCYPEQFNPNFQYDCWGNRVLDDGYREPGPLFNDEGFQKILVKAGIRWLFL